MYYIEIEGNYVVVKIDQLIIKEYVKVIKEILEKNKVRPNSKNIKDYMFKVARKIDLENIAYQYEEIRDRLN